MTTPVLVTVLATVAGVLIVGVGGGLIKPMQHRWEGYLTKAEEEAPKIKAQADAAPTVAQQARQAKGSVEEFYDQTAPSQSQGPGQSTAQGYSSGQGYDSAQQYQGQQGQQAPYTAEPGPVQSGPPQGSTAQQDWSGPRS